ncbi:MFS transporter [Falsiroseomonas sp. E2-1-a20]|uniref:MFS transporter n=1 Tax=Falsiroseomonas sp. E2-1-a20 TaxID=3239300 RepID=UPI003F3E5664
MAGAFLVTMVGFGAIYSYAAFAEEIASTFGSSRASVSFVYALSGGTCFFVSAVAGRLADRIGARALATMGMLLVGLGFLVASGASSITQVYVGYGVLIGVGCGFAYVPAITAVQRWFDTHRGLASGIAVSGIGIGTALVPSAADAFSHFGDWRTAFIACGLLAALIGVSGALLLAPSPVQPASEMPASLDPLPETVPTRDFALTYAGTLLVSMPAVLPHAMLVGTARDMGFDRHAAVALLGLVGLGTILGRFVLAALADVVGRRGVFLLCCGGMSSSMLLWAIAEDESTLQIFALMFGALQGGFVALLPAFVADSFGTRRLGGVLGMLYTARGIALLSAPPLLTIGVAILPGHTVPLAITTVVGTAGTILFAAVRRGRIRQC